LPDWLYEAGIGENRAALVDRGAILEIQIERDALGPRAGAILDARLTRKADGSGRGLVTFDAGGDARLLAVSPDLTEGARLRVELVRESLPEEGARKPAHARLVDADTALRDGPDLRARLRATGLSVRETRADSGLLDAHGWIESVEEAESGLVARDAALLHISPTPAMTLIDVDGAGTPLALAIAGARLAGQAIRRFDIAGSIGVDLPTLTAKADRQAAAQALDAVLPQPFERTAVNGFGFLQIVRRRIRPSLIEQLRADPVATAVLALLRAGERAKGHGALTLVAAPLVIDRIAKRPDWQDELARRIGARIALRPDPSLSISGAHGTRDHPL
jgi:hypothetical protein